MGYPLINGAEINGSEESAAQGIDLVTAGQGTLVVSLVGVSAYPLEFGAHKGQVGVDVAGRPAGLDLVRAGLGVISVAQPEPNVTLLGVSAQPLGLGTPSAGGAIALTGVSAIPVELGNHGVSVGLMGQSAYALELGGPGTAHITLSGISAQVLEFGTPSAAFAVSVSGIDLVTAGQGRIFSAAALLQGSSAYPLELGDTDTPTVAMRGRPAFPLQLGQPTISRGATC